MANQDEDIAIIELVPGHFLESNQSFPFKDEVTKRACFKKDFDQVAYDKSMKFVQSELTHELKLENTSNFCYANVIIQMLICCGRLFWNTLLTNESSCDFSSLFVNNYLLPYQKKASSLSSQILREYVQEMILKKPSFSYSDDKEQDAGFFFLDLMSLFCAQVQECFKFRKQKCFECFGCGKKHIEDKSDENLVLFLVNFESCEIEFERLFFKEIEKKCFHCNETTKLYTYNIFGFEKNSFLVIRLQTVHGRKRIKALVKNFNPDLVFIPNGSCFFRMIGAISYYQNTNINCEQNGHFAFWRRKTEKQGWARFSDSQITYYETFDEKFEDLMLLLLVKL